jgi:hypothetical protein
MSDAPGWGTPEQPPNWGHGQSPYPNGGASTPSKVGLSVGGFFTGVAWVVIIPLLLAGILGAVLDNATPAFIAAGVITLLPPIVLLFVPKARRFAAFWLMGMAVTAIVLAGVCAAFIALITANES